MVAEGGDSVSTVSVASALVTLPKPFETTTRLATTRKAYRTLGARNTSQLRGRAPRLTVSGPRACRRRPDCLPAARKAYGLRFERFVAAADPYAALGRGTADLAFVSTTDGQLGTGRYRTLEDDRRAFPPNHLTLLVRSDVLRGLGRDAPELVERIQRGMSEDVMRELNGRVELRGHEPDRVAADFLREAGFTPP
jgi:glycine betaine/choline ABC-type transport system substrate-binding protein